MKGRNFYILFAIILGCLISSTTAFADVKIKSRQTMSGQSYENTTYIKGKRERSERNMSEMQMISVTQCDLKRDLQIMPQAKTYMVNLWNQAESTAPTTTTAKQVKTEKGGVVTTTYTVKDTGERKQMFGYTARHLIITIESDPSPDACNKQKTKMQTDGWYIDAVFALDCEMERTARSYNKPQNSGCLDRYEMKQVGTGKRGFPLYEKMTMFDESGKESFSMVNEVVELSNTTLDAALFDAPAGYREVKDSQELYASMAKQSMPETSDSQSYGSSSTNSGLAQNVKNMSSSANTKPAAEVGAKKAGVVRIGLANVKISAVGEGLSASDLSAAVQNSLMEYLKVPNVEVVPLEAKLSAAAEDEAKQKECDYVIYATVSHKKGGGGFGMFGKALGAAVAQTGGGAWGNTVANTAGAVASRTIVAATLSSNVKSKDEITLDIKLSKSGAMTMAKQFKAKAKGDGDDIITQVIEQAAQAIVDAAK